MLETIGNRLCIQANALIGAGIISEANYKYMTRKGLFSVTRRACRNTTALVDLNSMPDKYRRKVEQVFQKDLDGYQREKLIEKRIKEDPEVFEFFSNYKTPSGTNLQTEKIKEYYNNAIVLNAIRELLNNRKSMIKALGGRRSGHWELLARELTEVDRKKYPHTLPENHRRLQEKFNNYTRDSYESLVHGNYSNVNSRKVDEQLERLLLSIYTMGNKPYGAWVNQDYHRFLAGDLTIVDMHTGELFNNQDFYNVEKGCYRTISDATCLNYINNPKNRVIVDRLRSTFHKFNSVTRPHHHRHAPNYGLSKISLDDRDLPRKMHDGNRVKAYYAYDVASGCIIGASYSVRKDTSLFIDCIRDMFRFIDKRGWGVPMEMEVEHHLVNQFEDDLMKAGVVFPLVRWCAPTNSQEKHAEHFNRRKKYGFEKRYQAGIGRWYARSEANQTGGERMYDDATDKYVVKEKTYSFEQLVADDLFTVELYNNSLHRNQKKYEKQTCMQVLENNLNPNLARINRALLVRYIGDLTKTSIQRNMYAQVQYSDYQLPNPEVLAKLQPNNYSVWAYYMPSDNIERVYLYQDDNFICEATKITTYNSSKAEWTDADTAAQLSQDKYIAQFDSMTKKGVEALAKIHTMPNLDEYDTMEVPATVPAVETPAPDPEEYKEYNDSEWTRQNAINSL